MLLFSLFLASISNVFVIEYLSLYSTVQGRLHILLLNTNLCWWAICPRWYLLPSHQCFWIDMVY